jgi:putative DNA modification/repair radical SAM protein
MAILDLKRKLSILADAAKYDASCASSGASKRDSRDGKGMGSTGPGMGICHAYAPDGRCISLLKVLLTNYCIYDCVYCVNRVSSNTERARFSVKEVVDLTLGFYRRNYIEGLFLSSGIIRDADYTMEAMVRVVKSLRLDHDFRGYVHLKLIPEASADLVAEAGLYADRVSINIELPKDESLARFAPEKDVVQIKRAMGGVRLAIEDRADAVKAKLKPPLYAPAGQSSQLIVGAEGSADGDILARSETLYAGYGMRRVYYSAFSPMPQASAALPLIPPPLMREHRLYQADWLMRFYGFERSEVAAPGDMLDLDIDPKHAWAIRHRERFPVDVNRADREALLRVPGLGVRSVDRLIAVRRYKPFVVAEDWTPGALLDGADLKPAVGRAEPEQPSLF